MQTVIQAHCSRGVSLRTQIGLDKRLEEYELSVDRKMKPGREPGWLKLKGAGVHGALNIQWDSGSAVLTCRVVTRAGGRPDSIVGAFVGYLLARHRKRIAVINVIPGR